MDLLDRLQDLAGKIRKQRELIQTEEAAKNAFVMPFLSALGYDVFNPSEVVPERPQTHPRDQAHPGPGAGLAVARVRQALGGSGLFRPLHRKRALAVHVGGPASLLPVHSRQDHRPSPDRSLAGKRPGASPASGRPCGREREAGSRGRGRRGSAHRDDRRRAGGVPHRQGHCQQGGRPLPHRPPGHLELHGYPARR